MSAKALKISIISPALAAANNGNWRSAERWARFLDDAYRVSIRDQWPGPDPIDSPPDLLIALHARKSAASISAFAATGRPLILVLTGTDLYRDIHSDPAAVKSLELASRLVVLQAHGLQELSPQARAKAVVIEQSAPALKPLPPETDHFDLAMVGHLRAEKDPLTAARAVMQLPHPQLRLLQIGDSEQDQCGRDFAELTGPDARIQRLGNLPHRQARDLIRHSRLLLLPSVMEGGANVLIEAVRSGVPALCSAISGSFGILGEDYPGYFPVGDDEALARLIGRCIDDAGFLAGLGRACAARSHLFEPARERRLVNELIASMPGFGLPPDQDS